MLNNQHLSVLIEKQAEKYGSRKALAYRNYETDTWIPISWKRFAERVLNVSRSLIALGVGRQERIAIFSQNKPECFYVSFGGYGVSAVTIPFYATSSGAQVTYMMNDADVRLLFVGEQEQYDTAFSVVSLCNHLEKIIIFDSHVQRKPNDTISMYFDEFLSFGKTADNDAEIQRRKDAATFDDMADILYTSGTTGNSKGVILTYGMYHAAIAGNDATLPLSEKAWCQALFVQFLSCSLCLCEFLLRLGIEVVDGFGIVLIHHVPFHFQRIRQFAVLHRERMRQKDEMLHFLVVGKILLQRVDALCH